MKKSELFFSAIQVPIDFFMVVLAAISAYMIRNVPEILALKPKLYTFPFSSYIKIVLIVVPFFIIVYALYGLYDIRATRKLWQEILKIFLATSVGLIIIIVTIFLKREWFSSRFVILSAWILITLYVTSARYFVQLFQKWLLKKYNIGIHRLLLIGRNGKIGNISQLIKRNKNLGYRIIDQISSASIKKIKKIKYEKGIDEIILCDSSITDEEQEKIIDYTAIHNIKFRYIPTALQTSKFKIGVLEGEPIIEVLSTPLDGWGRILKRIFDIVVSSVGIIATLPVMFFIALAIKLEDGGPIIYKNKRVGNKRKPFFVYKFRYMKWQYCITKENKNLDKALQIEKDLIKKQSVRKGPLYKIKNDPRKTKIGKFIEKYSLDELPQFFNVFLGSMSMVGPRPHQKREVAKYMEYHRRLLTIKPGVTGMAQVSGRSDLAFEQEYKLDVYYIENWSLWLDIQICFKTMKVLFKKRQNL